MLEDTTDLLESSSELVDIAIPIVFALALLFFFWGVANYILKSGQEKDEGKKIMVWGVVALFVMSSVWGLTKFIRTELGIGVVDSQKIPSLSR